MRFLWSYGWDQHYYRMIGTLFDPAFTGILSILTWLVLFSLKKKLPQWLLWTTSTGLLLAVLLTYSRASYLSAAVLALLIIGYKIARESIISRNRLLIIVVLVSSVLGFLIAPKPGGEGVNLLRTETIYARLNTARAALKAMSGTEWLVGNGLFSESIFSSSDTQTTTATHARMPDNIFITLLTQTGIIGLLLACGIAIRAISSLMRTDAELAFAWIVVLVHSQFNNSLLQPFVLLYLLLFMMSYGFKVTTRSILDSLPA
ncbi:O-antigen ligase family protein [Candidatus Woesebacteria bacterium]|nr:O-antigen ligase family protein [Candidatus Woesebacteria bacterium]